MDLDKIIKKIFIENSEEGFQSNIDAMKRKANKNLLECTSADIDAAVERLYKKQALLESLANEADEAIEKFKEE